VVVELRPAEGVRAAGTDIPFGLRAEELAALVPAARERSMIHTVWARALKLPGIVVIVCDEGSGRLDAFHIEATDDARVPVVFAGVDVFEWPGDEVVDHLRAEGHRVESRRQLARVGDDLILFRFDGPRFRSLRFAAPRGAG
jgi:hypothetical protein